MNFKIDLVYLWVDGNDEEWLAKKKLFLGENFNKNTESLSNARNINNDELKYSLRSVYHHLPWINNIFIVTDNQVPEWLNVDHPQIKVVDIRDILPKEALPCYNSVVIEYFLYKIPDLSEHFLYSNDDMFVNANLNPDFFFTIDGLPIVRLQKAPFGKWIVKLRKKINLAPNIYRKTIDYAATLIENKFGKYFNGIPHHNIDAYLKSECKQLVEVDFFEEIQPIIKHHTRQENDIQRAIFSYYMLAKKKAKIKYTNRYTSARIRVNKGNFKEFYQKYNPILFCVNDSHKASDENRIRIKPFLMDIYPKKSPFEI